MTDRVGAISLSQVLTYPNLNPSETGDSVSHLAVPVISSSSGAGTELGGRVSMSKQPDSSKRPREKDSTETNETDETGPVLKKQGVAAGSSSAAASSSAKPGGNREIEFKATKVDPEQFKSALESLRATAKQTVLVIDQGTVIQEDHYLDHPAFKGTPFALYDKGAVSRSLRIRREESPSDASGVKKENHSLCVKVARKGSVESDHERREYEVKIGNPAETLEMFKQLGFAADKIIQKTRSSFLQSGEYEVVLDEVVGLKKAAMGYEQEFSSYMIEVELKVGAERVVDVPACLARMKHYIETVLQVTKYQAEHSGMEKYM